MKDNKVRKQHPSALLTISKRAFYVCFLLVALLCLSNSAQVSAYDPGSVAGSSRDNPNRSYDPVASGASWYYYEIKLDETDVDERFSDKENYDTVVKIPFSNNYGKQTQISKTELRSCAKAGGMWVLATNEYDTSQTIKPSSNTGKPATGLALKDILVNEDSFNDGTISIGRYKYKPLAEFPTSIKLKDKDGNEETINTQTLANRDSNVDGTIISTSIANNWTFVKEVFEPLKDTEYVLDKHGSPKEWDKNSSMSFFCSGEKSNAAQKLSHSESIAIVKDSEDDVFGTKSSPVKDGTSYLGSEDRKIEVPNGDTGAFITFQHMVVDGDPSPTWTISNPIIESDAAVTQVDISSINKTGNVFSQTFRYNMAGDEEAKICQTITSTDGVSSTACVYISATKNASLTNCAAQSVGGTTANDSQYHIFKGNNANIGAYGNTVGSVSVKNYNNSSENMDTEQLSGGEYFIDKAGYYVTQLDNGKNYTVQVYAKPGDNVRFVYNYCSYAPSVYNTFGNKEGGYKMNKNYPTLSTKVEFNVFSKREIGGSNNGLLNMPFTFDGDLLKYYRLNTGPPGTENLSYWANNIAVPGAKASTENPGNLLFQIPSKESKYNFGCELYNGSNPTIVDSFQIPGLEKPDDRCFSSKVKKATTEGSAEDSSLVGESLVIELKYNNTKIWPATFDSYEEAFNYNRDHIDVSTVSSTSPSGEYEVIASEGDAMKYDAMAYESIITKTAKVLVPFNFKTSLHTSITSGNGEIVYAGESVTSTHYAKIEKRSNPLVSSSEYATITPNDTKAVAVEYIIKKEDGSAEANTIDGHSILQDAYYSQDDGGPCGYFGSGIGIVDCKTTGKDGKDILKEGAGNPESKIDGAKYIEEEINRAVPDYPAGYRYCVATAIYHGDSHGNDGGNLVKDPSDNHESTGVYYAGEDSPSSGNAFGANDISVSKDGVTAEATTSSRWHISASSCRTIAKKPTFQVLNGGVFSKGDIITSVSRKVVNADLGEDYESSLSGDNGRLFGSWAEYFVVAGGTVEGFASAAGLGYNGSSGNDIVKGQENDSIKTDFCLLSRLSIANTRCQENIAGSVDESITNNIISQGFDIFIKKFRDRYTNKNMDPISCTSSSHPICSNILYDTNYSDLPAQSIIGTYGWYLDSDPDSDPDPTIDSYDCDYTGYCYHVQSEDGFTGNARYVKINAPGGYTINKEIQQKSGTRIIDIEGDLTISSDICYGKCDDEPAYNSLSEIPQIIIFADNIKISQDVKRIDAWLFAGKMEPTIPGSGEPWSPGYVNTCSELGGTWIGYNIDTCHETLKINGPVFTGELYLRRSAGAWNGYQGEHGSDNLEQTYSTGDLEKGSIAPGEIFDINPITYLWAYYQAQRFSHAIVTWQDEVAPRL